MLSGRTRAREFAVTGHGDQEEAQLMSAERDQQIALAAIGQEIDDSGDSQRLHQQHILVRDQRPALEHQHPGQEVERKRQHPEQRRGGNVGGDVRGDGDEQARWHGGEKDPAQAQ